MHLAFDMAVLGIDLACLQKVIARLEFFFSFGIKNDYKSVFDSGPGHRPLHSRVLQGSVATLAQVS